jgi:uncharacterized protein YfaS (alpha-2-macroglobulin family)
MMDENTATVDVPVLPEYKPNVYISASVIRSTNSLERHAPVRAFGVVPLSIDCGDNKLDIALDVPDEMRPLQPLKVLFKVTSSIQNQASSIRTVETARSS